MEELLGGILISEDASLLDKPLRVKATAALVVGESKGFLFVALKSS